MNEEGFIAQSPIKRTKDAHLQLIGPRIGGFVDAPGGIYLRDRDDNRYPLNQVGIASMGFTENEGRFRFPRPFKYDQEGNLIRRGDTVLIFYERGDMTNPIVFGSLRTVDSSGATGENFHSFVPGEYEKIHEQYISTERMVRFKDDGKGGLEFVIESYDPPEYELDGQGNPIETEDTLELREKRLSGSLVYTIDKKGNITIDLAQVAGKTGEGNINLLLLGNDRTINGNLNIAFNGRAKFTQTDDVGKKLQEIEIGDEYVTIDSDQINLGGDAVEPVVLGDELKSLFDRLFQAIDTMTLNTSMGPTIPKPINAAVFASIKGDLDKMLSPQNRTE